VNNKISHQINKDHAVKKNESPNTAANGEDKQNQPTSNQ
jgi:hypothetical protein